MIDKTSPRMIDERLRDYRDSYELSAQKCLKSAPIGHIWSDQDFHSALPPLHGKTFVISSPSPAQAVGSDLFDQTALSNLAQRLVEAAKRAGADAPS